MSKKKQEAVTAIRDHIINGRKLSKKHKKIKERWDAAFSLLCNFHSTEQALPLLVSQFKISKATAYRDLACSLQVYGDVQKTSKDGHRAVIYEFAVKTFQLAAKNGDYKAMNSAVANMIKLRGLDRDEPDMPDFESFEGNVYPIVLDPKIEALLGNILESGGSLDLSKLINEEGEYVPFEDLTGKATDTNQGEN